MAPSNFRPVSHVELVLGASDVNSFEREIAQGRLGTTTGREVHTTNGEDWLCRKMWLAVVGRAADDATGQDIGDLGVADDPENPEPAEVENADELAVEFGVAAREWFGSDDYYTVMEFIGLGPVAGRIAKMKPTEIANNITEFRKREDAAVKGRRK